MRSVHVFYDRTAALKSTVFLVYVVNVVLLNTSAVYWRWLIENGLPLMAVLPVKMFTCKKSELSGEIRGHWPRYWFMGTQVVQVEKRIMPWDREL